MTLLKCTPLSMVVITAEKKLISLDVFNIRRTRLSFFFSVEDILSRTYKKVDTFHWPFVLALFLRGSLRPSYRSSDRSYPYQKIAIDAFFKICNVVNILKKLPMTTFLRCYGRLPPRAENSRMLTLSSTVYRRWMSADAAAKHYTNLSIL